MFTVLRRLAKDWWTYTTNVPPIEYLEKLANAACCVGNSSSFIRDAGYFGTPVVLVGNRQEGRECGEHVTFVDCLSKDILEAINQQLEHGRYTPSNLYGSPGVSRVIADKLATLKPRTNKRLDYRLEAVA